MVPLMVRIPLIGDSCKSKSEYLATRQLPDFYMEDFSILGFSVGQYDEACALLREAGYTMLEQQSGTDLLLEDIRQVAAVKDILQQNAIKVELSDIADTIYQA
jgi:hypothetical protein